MVVLATPPVVACAACLLFGGSFDAVTLGLIAARIVLAVCGARYGRSKAPTTQPDEAPSSAAAV
ncbi:hypothetical protein [Streptomyces heilongjiangensis]|uniref:hypothetical protein n=1 Tax=Streptomyces heilongjiangensis TaxID=945052 RepID=UPI00232E35AF|nr:hypothetical protein [Streptomyces heilongjiangensis]MDC2952223.1 hypothetical protein [Streptomyces heilongjiangensis]